MGFNSAFKGLLKTIIPTYFLFDCLCYIPRIFLGLFYSVYWGPCKVHMQCLLHAVSKVQSVEGSTVQCVCVCVNWQ
jgi:hypothetical protein